MLSAVSSRQANACQRFSGKLRDAGSICHNAGMAAKGLTECWRAAVAPKPSDWKLMGVVSGTREVDPAIRNPEEWCAWARGPNEERLEGRGPSPEDALQTLALRLKEL